MGLGIQCPLGQGYIVFGGGYMLVYCCFTLTICELEYIP